MIQLLRVLHWGKAGTSTAHPTFVLEMENDLCAGFYPDAFKHKHSSVFKETLSMYFKYSPNAAREKGPSAL